MKMDPEEMLDEFNRRYVQPTVLRGTVQLIGDVFYMAGDVVELTLEQAYILYRESNAVAVEVELERLAFGLPAVFDGSEITYVQLQQLRGLLVEALRHTPKLRKMLLLSGQLVRSERS